MTTNIGTGTVLITGPTSGLGRALPGLGQDHRAARRAKITSLRVTVIVRVIGGRLGGRLSVSNRRVPLVTDVNGTLSPICGRA